MTTFTDLFTWFDRLGVADSLLPFLLVFSIIFAILERVKIFGENNKKTHVIIALIMGILFVIPHVTGTYPSGSDPVSIINTAIPNVGVVLIAIIMIMLIVGVFGHNLNIKGSALSVVVILLAFGYVIYIFGWAAGWWSTGGTFSWGLGFLGDPETRAMLIVLAVFLIVVFVIIGGKGPAGEGKRGFGKIIEYFQNMLKD